MKAGDLCNAKKELRTNLGIAKEFHKIKIKLKTHVARIWQGKMADIPIN